MLCVFRVDASSKIGTGHIIRCLTLAKKLRREGGTVHFISRLHECNLCDFVEDNGFNVHRLSASLSSFTTNDLLGHAGWLGVTWKQDVEETIAVLKTFTEQPTWLIVDHYGLDSRWEECLSPFVQKTLVIDDLADRKHHCDLLLDQNLVESLDTRYLGLVNDTCGLLLGPDYVLLQDIYFEYRKKVKFHEGKIERILVFLGGADNENITGMSLQALLTLGNKKIHIDVVLGNSFPYFNVIETLAEGHTNIHVYSGLPSLAPLMSVADLAIGAVGTTTWERCCLGLPTLAVTIAENQKPVASFLRKKGLIDWLGHKNEINCQIIAEKVKKIISYGLDKEWSRRCYELVDGKGTCRVQRLLCSKK